MDNIAVLQDVFGMFSNMQIFLCRHSSFFLYEMIVAYLILVNIIASCHDRPFFFNQHWQNFRFIIE